MCSKQREISFEEFELHDGSDPDELAWTLVNGKIYDITEWIKHHPGGSYAIRLIAGRDGSTMIDQYHPLPSTKGIVSNMIENCKYIKCIGILKCNEIDASKLKTNVFCVESNEFYNTLISRIASYCSENKIDIHGNIIYNTLDGLIYFILLVWSGIAMMYHWAYYMEYIFCVFHAIISYHGGLLAHTANHYGFNNNLLNNLMSQLLDYSGYDSNRWIMAHNVIHHILPNTLGHDYFVETNLVRLHPQKQLKYLYRFQHIYFSFLILFKLPSWFIQEFIISLRFILTKQITKKLSTPSGFYVNLNNANPIKMFCWKCYNIFFYFILKYILIRNSNERSNTLMTYIVFDALLGLFLVLSLVVNHIHKDMYSKINGQQHWSEISVINSANFSTINSNCCTFWCFMFGGLNYQIEHHLFPSMNPTVYPQISHIVRKTCQEFKLKYVNYDNFYVSLTDTFKHLYHLGHFYDYKKQ